MFDVYFKSQKDFMWHLMILESESPTGHLTLPFDYQVELKEARKCPLSISPWQWRGLLENQYLDSNLS